LIRTGPGRPLLHAWLTGRRIRPRGFKSSTGQDTSNYVGATKKHYSRGGSLCRVRLSRIWHELIFIVVRLPINQLH
jgi:hypothetical protein